MNREYYFYFRKSFKSTNYCQLLMIRLHLYK